MYEIHHNIIPCRNSILKGASSGLDKISKVDIHDYDSILDKQLYMYNLYRPHRIQLVYYKDSLLRNYILVDETQTNGYRPSKKAKTYTYYTGMQYLFESMDLWSGIIKSFVFGTLIFVLGYYHGINAKPGAHGVGLATMNVVVSSCLMILIADFALDAVMFF